MPLLTTGQAGAALGVTGETVRRWVADGKLEAIRLPSGQLRFAQATIDALLERGAE